MLNKDFMNMLSDQGSVDQFVGYLLSVWMLSCLFLFPTDQMQPHLLVAKLVTQTTYFLYN